jgi:acetamidase/formamidase/AraC-like DNA-binding protein
MLADRWDFKTSSYASEQQASAWSENLARLSFALVIPSAGQAVEASAKSQRGPDGVICTRISAGPQSLASVSRPDAGVVWLALLLEGQGRLSRPGDSLALRAGDIAVGHVGTPAGLVFETAFRASFVRIPGVVIGRRMVSPPTGYLGVLPRDAGIASLLSALLTSVAQTLDNMTPELIRLLEGTLAEFLMVALTSASAALTGASANQAHMLKRICADIETRLSDPELTLATVADAQGMSPRYLQKLFESAGDNFVHYLRRRRLERSRADIVNPAFAQLSISEICFRWGFNDAAHFSRVFREHFGVAPRGLRAQVLNSAPAEAKATISRGWPDGYERELRRAKADAISPEKKHPRPVTLPYLQALAGDGSVEPRRHHLAVSERSVHWGFLNRALEPVLEVRTGDFVTVETLTHHASDDFERMIEGDEAAENVFRWNKEGKAVDRRGAGPMDASVHGRGAGEGFGVHICTGPIAVLDAEPGDVIELRILDIALRPSGNPKFGGKTYGSNAAAWWGFHHDDFLTEPRPREVVTIFEITDEEERVFARPIHNYRWTPQCDPFGVVHATMDYPGVPIDPATIEKTTSGFADMRIPARLHFGFVALAPRESGNVDSVPPAYFGGNMDNWRLGKGAKVYLPVSVPGGLLSIGDPHAAQGDGEVNGTAIEASLTGKFQVVLHKKGATLEPAFADLDYPILETEAEWIVHGFSHPNYLAEFGEYGQSEIYRRASLDTAMRDAFRKMRRFLMAKKGLSEDAAISLISVGVDFCVTQVVDGNLGVHAILRKELFAGA